MPQSLARVLVHLVFSTKNRAPLITPDRADTDVCLFGGNSQRDRLPSRNRRRCDGPRSFALRVGTHDLLEQDSRGTQKGVLQMGQGQRAPGLLLAKRLRRLFCQPVERGTREGVHRRSGETPPGRDVPGRIAVVIAPAWNRMGRAVRLGLTPGSPSLSG